jgi:hypothetical protein
MKEFSGNIWDLAQVDDAVVIPTNIGWTTSGHNIMSAGLAKDLKFKFPWITWEYGQFCKTWQKETPVNWIDLKVRAIISPFRFLVLFPTKPLNKEHPWLSWKNKSSLDLIERSCKQLQDITKDIFISAGVQRVLVPLVGCGNGGLEKSDVVSIMDKYLKESVFVRVTF